MKKLAMLVAAIALALPAPLMLPTAAQADSSSSSRYVPGFCRTEILPVYAVNVGQCVSVEETSYQYFTRGTDGYATHYCELLRDAYPDAYDAMFSSWTDCVHFAHDAIGH